MFRGLCRVPLFRGADSRPDQPPPDSQAGPRCRAAFSWGRLLRSPATASIKLARLALLLAWVVPALRSEAGDWPQLLGPARNGIATGEQLLDKLPDGGPAVLWQRSVGDGFAGVAIQGDRGVLFHRLAGDEVAEGFEPSTGKVLWTHRFKASYSGSLSSDQGPRCVPVLQDGAAYLCGAAGDLHCVALSDGEVRWSRGLGREWKTPEGYFGIGSTPVVAGELLLWNAGAPGGRGVVALSRKTGETVWQATNEQASYSSPIVAEVGGQAQAIFITRLQCLALEPRSGKLLWQFPFGARGPTVNAATPLVLGDLLFVSASYGVGGHCARLTADGPVEVWSNNDTLSSQYTTAVLVNGMLYGIDGRADTGGARLRCVEPATGRVLWTVEEFGVAHMIAAGDKLLLVKDNGTLVLAQADSTRYRELGSHRILKSTTRALPALAGGRLFVRDERQLVALSVGR